MKINNKFINQTGGFLGASLIRGWMKTLDYKAALHDPAVDPIHPNFSRPAIFMQWHEYIPILFYLRGNCGTAMLISQHQDGEWLCQAARHMGYETIRGSTTRGGVAAMKQIFRDSKALNLAITPDGPRGPRRKLAPGAIFLSSRLGIPLIAIGLGYDRPWRFNTWDRFAVPRPYSRARIITSPMIQIPPNLDRAGIEQHRERHERLLNDLTDEAEAWATTGSRYANQISLHREGVPLHVRRAA
jgi:lysophospholipid acyltransferase (LPLAT)-like uncharacterized protein